MYESKLKKDSISNIVKTIPIIAILFIAAFSWGYNVGYSWEGSWNRLSEDGTAEIQKLNVSEVYWNNENRTDTLAYPEQTASHIIFKSGSTIYAKNGTTGKIDYSGTNATTIIQSIIASNFQIYVKEGTYEVRNITLPSNISIFMSDGAILNLPITTSSAGIFIANNVENIHIEGGILEGNEELQTDGEHHGIWFTNVTDSYISCWIKGFRWYDARLDNSNIEFENRWYGSKWNQPICIYPDIDTLSSGNKDLYIEFDPSIDLRNKMISFLANYTDYIAIRIYIDGKEDYIVMGGASFSEAGTSWFAPDILDNGSLNRFYAAHHSVSVTQDVFKSVNKIWLRHHGDATHCFGNVWLHPLPNEGLVTLRFDDGSDIWYDDYAPILAEHGYEGNAFIYVDSGANMDKIRALSSVYGWEISSHSITHPHINEIPIEDGLEELIGSKKYLMEQGTGKGYNFFAFPYHDTNYTTWQMAQRIYIDSANTGKYVQGINIKIPWITNFLTTETISIDEGIFRVMKYHFWEFIITHAEKSVEEMQELCEKLNSAGVRVVTMPEIYSQYGYVQQEIGYVIENSGTTTNSTATTFVFNHELAGTPDYVWASFNTTAISGYSWTTTSTQITITVFGSGLPEIMAAYWKAEFSP